MSQKSSIALQKKAKADEAKQAKKTKADAEKLAKKAKAEAKKQAKQEKAEEEKQQTIEAQNQKVYNVTRFMDFMSKIKDPNIILLQKKEVVQWLFEDMTFLPEIIKKNKTADGNQYKILEDKWGQAIMKLRRPDLKLDKQWTNNFGEYICEEIYTLMGKVVSRPVIKENHKPDLEVDDTIIEVKTQTFFTTGTAGEKILGSPFKYAEIPDLYGKSLKIVCIGGAEKVCRETYGNLPGLKCSIQKKKFLDFFRENKIEYIAASDILVSLMLVSLMLVDISL